MPFLDNRYTWGIKFGTSITVTRRPVTGASRSFVSTTTRVFEKIVRSTVRRRPILDIVVASGDSARKYLFYVQTLHMGSDDAPHDKLQCTVKLESRTNFLKEL